MRVPPERVIRFALRTVIAVLLLIIATVALIEIVSVTRQVIIWIFIAIFFALAMSPLVDWFQARVVKNRGLATGLAFVTVLGALAALAATLVPTLVSQVNDLVDELPTYVADLTAGKGRLGFLQEDYQIVDKVEKAVKDGGATKLLGLSGTALAVTKGVLTIVVAAITIVFLTFFMLLEGRQWTERFYSLLPSGSEERWRRIGTDIQRTVGGYVTGNLLLSVIAGVVSTVVFLLVGLPYAVALGLIVALFDLIPLAGATIAAVIVTTIAVVGDSVQSGIIVGIFFLVYQQLENHVLQPVVYGRTVQLSPLAVLVAVLIGGSLAGVLGALGAIPVAGTIQVLLREWIAHRRERVVVPGPGEPQPETVV